MVKQPADAFVPVPYPPPPARVEFVPRPPASAPDAVWLHGEWDHRFNRWAWTHGRWERPPRGAQAYSPWSLRRDARGDLWFAPGAWRDARGEVLEPNEALATGSARDRSVLEEDGTRQSVAPNRAPPPPPPADE
jgi:hypothetical protein